MVTLNIEYNFFYHMLLVLLTACCVVLTYVSLRLKGFNVILVPIVPEISGTIFQNIPEISGTFRNSVTIRKSGTTFRKFPVYGKKIVPEIVPEFRISGTFSIMEIEKNSGSFPYVNRNPEFRWKPYTQLTVY